MNLTSVSSRTCPDWNHIEIPDSLQKETRSQF